MMRRFSVAMKYRRRKSRQPVRIFRPMPLLHQPHISPAMGGIRRVSRGLPSPSLLAKAKKSLSSLGPRPAPRDRAGSFSVNTSQRFQFQVSDDYEAWDRVHSSGFQAVSRETQGSLETDGGSSRRRSSATVCLKPCRPLHSFPCNVQQPCAQFDRAFSLHAGEKGVSPPNDA